MTRTGPRQVRKVRGEIVERLAHRWDAEPRGDGKTIWCEIYEAMPGPERRNSPGAAGAGGVLERTGGG
ncbi:hypothetical protein ABZZ79_32480 [Streptomyces sp. NPDC006458]|uniref:hypothetical protein n=1 Tax=Streptomyces sp. NPDC006458 TaxID=3154302 RepID=UPI0033A036FC